MRRLIYFAIAISMGTAATAGVEGDAARKSSNDDFIARNYPPEALKRGEQGKVTFRLTVEEDGAIARCDVTESSGFAILDRQTCELLVLHADMKPATDQEGRAVPSMRTGYIDWRLPAGRAAATRATSVPKPDPMICKRSSKPGSHVAKVRRCMTESEWALQERLVQDDVARSRDRVICSDHGC